MTQAVFRAIFTPGCWFKRAARVLGCHPAHVRNLALGHRKLTRRQRVILENYARARAGARSSYRKREIEKLERQIDQEDKALETAILILRAKK